jgi:PAS domain S-box-containing protein
MNEHSDDAPGGQPDWKTQRMKIIGLGESSIRKSYYPELQQKHAELVRKNEELQAAYEELTATNEELTANYDELKEKETELRESEERYRTLIETTDTGFVIIDGAGLVIDANDKYVHFTGRGTLQELIGRSVLEWTAEHDRDRNATAIRQCLKEGFLRNFETDYLDPAGRIIPVEVNAGLVRVNGSDRIIILCRDITDRHRAQIALDQARRKMNLLNTVTFQDIQGAAFSLSGYHELIRKVISDESARTYLEKELPLIGKIIDSLNFAKNYQEMGINSPKWQNVNQTFLFAISHLDFLHIARHSAIGELEIYADPLLETIFFNLMDNVLRHGGTVTEVTLRYDEHPEGLDLIVEDNGIGIPTEEKNMIFDRGYGKHGGLGLFLVREILSITGITIRETGIPGRGARFVIHVPSGAYRIPDEV